MPPDSPSPTATEPSGLTEIAADIAQHAPLPAPRTGADTLAAVMCSLVKTFDDSEIFVMLDLLPPDLRPLVRACARHGEMPRGDEKSVVARVAEHLQVDRPMAEHATWIVLEALLQRLPHRAAQHLVEMLPAEVRHVRAEAVATGSNPPRLSRPSARTT